MEDKIIVMTQSDMDAIPIDYAGDIIIHADEAIRVYNRTVCVSKGTVYAYEKSVVKSIYNAVIYIHNESIAYVSGMTEVHATDCTIVHAKEHADIEATRKAIVYAEDNVSGKIYDNCTAYIRGKAVMEAYNKSTVYAQTNCGVYVWDQSNVYASCNVNVINKGTTGEIECKGNARVVSTPKDPAEYIAFWGLENDGDTVRMYTAANKSEGKYYSIGIIKNEYKIGDITTYVDDEWADEYYEDDCDLDIYDLDKPGLNVYNLEWAVSQCIGWDDRAVLEIDVDIDDLIAPLDIRGEIRANKYKVVREVPLEECGPLGQALARRQS